MKKGDVKIQMERVDASVSQIESFISEKTEEILSAE